MISIVSTEGVMEAFHSAIVLELFSLEVMCITETEATPVTGTKEITIGTEMTIGIETEAGTKATTMTEIGITTTIVEGARTETITETTVTAEIRDLLITETTRVTGEMETQGATAQVIPLQGAAVQAIPLQGAAVPTLLLKEAAETKLQALRQEDARTPEERRFKLQDLQPKALTTVLVEEMIAEEEVCQIELKRTIRVEEEIVFNQRIAASAAIFA